MAIRCDDADLFKVCITAARYARAGTWDKRDDRQTQRCLAAADITGTWQATLGAQGPEPLRLVLRISKDSSGGFSGAAYSIDQGTEAIPAREMMLKGDTFSFSAPDVGGTYTGTLSADGTSIAGTWTQRQPRPLTSHARDGAKRVADRARHQHLNT